jgi:hypothetical protein
MNVDFPGPNFVGGAFLPIVLGILLSVGVALLLFRRAGYLK